MKWECTDAKRHLDSCGRARILFISRTESRVAVTLDNRERREFEIAGDEAVREIDVLGRMGSLTLITSTAAEGKH